MVSPGKAESNKNGVILNSCLPLVIPACSESVLRLTARRRNIELKSTSIEAEIGLGEMDNGNCFVRKYHSTNIGAGSGNGHRLVQVLIKFALIPMQQGEISEHNVSSTSSFRNIWKCCLIPSFGKPCSYC